MLLLDLSEMEVGLSGIAGTGLEANQNSIQNHYECQKVNKRVELRSSVANEFFVR